MDLEIEIEILIFLNMEKQINRYSCGFLVIEWGRGGGGDNFYFLLVVKKICLIKYVLYMYRIVYYIYINILKFYKLK